ncbi:MAG: hypothetical protein Q9157_005117, partial [Trypethelium eluteriae]
SRTSPAAFVIFNWIGIFTGTPVQTSLSDSYVCYTEELITVQGETTVNGISTWEAYTTASTPDLPVVKFADPHNAPITIDLDPPFVYVNDSFQTNFGYVDIPQSMIDYLDSLPSVTGEWPYIACCSFGGGEGAPSVHIAVNELTDTQRATVTVDRTAPGIHTLTPTVMPPTPAPAPMPSPTNQPQPVPVTEPASNPISTAAPGFTAPTNEAKTPAVVSHPVVMNPSPSPARPTQDNPVQQLPSIDNGNKQPSSGGAEGSVTGLQGINGGASSKNQNSAGSGNSGLTETDSGNSASGANSASTSPGQGSQQEEPRIGHFGSVGSQGSSSARNTEADKDNGGSHSAGPDRPNEKYTASQSGEDGSNNGNFASDTNARTEAANRYLDLLDTGGGSDELDSGTNSALPNSPSLPSSSDLDWGSDSSSEESEASASPTLNDVLLSAALGSNVILPVGSSRHISALVAPSGGIILPNSQTLVAGHATTYDGVSIFLPPNQGGATAPSEVIIGSNFEAPGVPLAATGATTPSPTFDINGQHMPISWILSGGGIILPNGQTLSAGYSTNINDVPLSLAPDGNALVEGSLAISLSAPTTEESLTIGSNVMPISYAQSNEGIILFNSQILHPGEATTISGTTISLTAGETAVVVNGKTEALNPPASTTGIGGYVASGIGAGRGSNTILNGTPGSTAQAAGSKAKSDGDRNNIWMAFAISLFATLIIV